MTRTSLKWPRLKAVIVDPRKNEDMRIELINPRKSIFSSLAENRLVIRVFRVWGGFVGDVESLFDEALIYRVLEATHKRGFFNVFPGRSLRLMPSLCEVQPRSYGDAWFGQFELTRAAVADFNRKMRAVGSYEEWIIGSCAESLVPRDARLLAQRSASPELHYFLSHINDVGCLWCFNLDIGELMLVFEPFRECDVVVEEITEVVRQSGGRVKPG